MQDRYIREEWRTTECCEKSESGVLIPVAIGVVVRRWLILVSDIRRSLSPRTIVTKDGLEACLNDPRSIHLTRTLLVVLK